MCSILACLLLLAQQAAADGFSPAMLETEFGKLSAGRRIAIGLFDSRFDDLEAAAGQQLQFALQLRPHLRRAIALDPDAGPQQRQPLEFTLAAGTTYSERRGHAPSYRRQGRPVWLGLAKSGPQPELLSFADGGRKGISVLSRLSLGSPGQSAQGLLLLDLTGSGRLSLVVPLSAGGQAASGIVVAEVAGDGTLTLLTVDPLPAVEGTLSLVDIDGDGHWEIESQLALDDMPLPAAPGPYRANQLHRWDRRRAQFVNVTAQFVWRYRPERNYYHHLLSDGAWKYSAALTDYLSQTWQLERVPE